MFYLAFLMAGLIWLVVLLFLRIHINLDYCYKRLESKINLKLRILFSSLHIEIIIPQEMFSTGLENILNNLIKDASPTEEVELQEKETKSRRYMFLRHVTGEVFRKYLSNWSKFLFLKNKILQLKKMFYRKIELKNISLKIEIGGRDAGETGILVGVIWALLGRMTARFYSNVTVKKDNIRYFVQPRFDEEILICSTNCILSLKNSHIIFTALKFFGIIIKIRRIENHG